MVVDRISIVVTIGVFVGVSVMGSVVDEVSDAVVVELVGFIVLVDEASVCQHVDEGQR